MFFFLGFQFGKEFVEVLLVLDNLFFRGFCFSQTHDRADGKTEDRADIGASLFRFDALPALVGIFAVILYQPASRCQTTQTSTDATIEAATEMRVSFLTFCSNRSVVASIALRLAESIPDRSEENFSLTLPSCCRIRRMEDCISRLSVCSTVR